jgi:hypothetical protein
MNDGINDITVKILEILRKEGPKGVPKKLVEEQLGDVVPHQLVEKSILHLLDGFKVDLVVDYPPEESELYRGRPIWHLRLLTTEESQILRALPPIKLALLKILRQTKDSDHPGEIPVERVRAILKNEGFDDEDTEWMRIEDRVRRVSTTRNGRQTECFQIIPEDEKTEEFKRAEEERIREWEEWDALKRKRSDEIDKEAEARMRRKQKRKKVS